MNRIAKATLKKAYDLADTFKYDIGKLRTYGDRLGGVSNPAGGMLDKLWKLENRFGRVNKVTNARWKKWATSAAARIGKLTAIAGGIGERAGARRFMKYLPVVGNILTGVFIASAIANPAQAMAEETGLSVEACQTIIDGNATITLGLWQGGKEVDTVELSDGSIVTIGDTLLICYVRDRDAVLRGDLQNGCVWTKQLEVKDIYTTDVEGVARLIFEDGSGRIQLELGEIVNPADEEP